MTVLGLAGKFLLRVSCALPKMPPASGCAWAELPKKVNSGWIAGAGTDSVGEGALGLARNCPGRIGFRRR